MGLDVNGVKFMLAAKAGGADFSSVVTIGRQRLHLSEADFKVLLRAFQLDVNDAQIRHAYCARDRYAEPFFELLGASRAESMDASDFEGASIVHDLNLPVGDDLKGAFSVVIDGGSLEHVFNFPIAIRSCMEMVRLGGHYLAITPANNFMGHGFYQFSPELYFRILCPENGFEMERVMLFESDPNAQWFDVPDPEVVKRRVELVNSKPTYLLVQARKIDARPLFASAPQQSDYVQAWNAGSS